MLGIPIRITFHNLRSTFATWAYAQTRDIRFVQQVLGHSDTRVTDRYAAVVVDHMRVLQNRVQLNPYSLPSEASNPGTPVGQAESNGVHSGALQRPAEPTQTMWRTSDAQTDNT